MARKKVIVEKRKLYTEEQISHAHKVVANRIHEIMESLGKSANVICYMLDPHRTAIGSTYDYNSTTVGNAIWNNLCRREGLEYDGNAGYTLLQLAEMIEKGEI